MSSPSRLDVARLPHIGAWRLDAARLQLPRLCHDVLVTSLVPEMLPLLADPLVNSEVRAWPAAW